MVSGAGHRGRRLGGNGVDGEALQLRGGEASMRNSGKLRRDGSRLHKNNNGERLEVRRDMGNGMESSKGGEVDGVDRKCGNSAVEWAAPASKLGSPGANWMCSSWGNRRGR